MQRIIKVRSLQRPAHSPAQGGVGAGAHQYPQRLFCRGKRCAEFFRHALFFLAVEGEIDVLGPHHFFQFGGADIKAVLVDECLHHRIHQHGNIQLLVHKLSDTRGADRFKEGRQ